MNRNNTKIIKIPVRFFVINFAWTWFFWLGPSWLGILGIPSVNAVLSAVGPATGIIASFGPAAGAIISLRSIEGSDSVKKFLKSFLTLNFGWKVWIFIFMVLGGSSFLAWSVPELFGLARPQKYLSSPYMFPLFFLMMVFFGGGQEEVGWRGYVMPVFEKKFGLIAGSGLLGVIWSVWHIPLWFMPGTNQIYMNFFAFMLGCIGLSYFFSWVIATSGGRNFSGLIAHGAMNAFMMLFPPILMESVTQVRFWISQIMIFIIGVIVVIVRSVKLKKEQVSQ